MEHKLTLTASNRTVLGKKVRHLRKQGELPIVLYGHDTEPQSLSVPVKSFRKVYRDAGQSSLIDVKVGDKSGVKVLIHDVQVDPVTDELLHADLFKVNMTEKVKTEVPLKFVGEAPAVKELEGNLITQRDHVTIEALPTDLIPEIEVDVSPLQTFDDTIKVADIKAKVPSTVTVLDEDEEIVALVTPPRSEEELAELEAPTTTEAEGIAQLEATAEAERQAKEAEKTAEEGPAESGEAAPQPEKNKE